MFVWAVEAVFDVAAETRGKEGTEGSVAVVPDAVADTLSGSSDILLHLLVLLHL